MRFNRLPVKDPRTVARDIPGICDLLFPQLLPGIVAYLNRECTEIECCTSVSESLIQKTSITAAMLFEVAYAKTEQELRGEFSSWDDCLNIAVERQNRFFDAEVPEKITSNDIEVAELTSSNLFKSLKFLNSCSANDKLEISPEIQGYHWIAKGNGDFSIGDQLIEVKCSSSNFSSSDYRQLLIYWLLSYSDALENDGLEWKTGILLNPRLNKYVEINFSEFISIVSGGLSKVEILELFSSLIGDYSLRLKT